MSNQQSSLTLKNTTDFTAQFTVKKGGQVIVFMPAVEPGQTVTVPSNDTYQVIASTVINGNTYTSAPITVTGSTGFLAQVVQEYRLGTYVFDVLEVGSTSSSELQFQSTWRDAVTFAILKDGKLLQNVICADAFNPQVIAIGDIFSFQAVINGVTTDLQYTNNPNAVCTALDDTTLRNSGYYTLSLK